VNRLGAVGALLEGVRRVGRAPLVVLAAWIVSLLTTLPLALVLRDTLAASLGQSLAADTAASGVNYDWMQQVAGESNGLAATFKPAIIGPAALLENLSGFLDNAVQPVPVIAAVAASMVAWLFFAAGIIDRYARDRPTRMFGFFAVSGGFFLRFLRLGLCMAIAYLFLFRVCHPWLFLRVFPRLTREMTVERTAFLVRIGLYVPFACAVAACNIVFDYAKVRAIVEDRRSMIGAITAGLRFIVRNAPVVTGLYVLDVLLFLLVAAVYGLAASGATGGRSFWLGFFAGQLYILARLFVKLVFWASETTLFQSRLAHAGYVAGPARIWPESPLVEAISERS
jgi:hypothetical protein